MAASTHPAFSSRKWRILLADDHETVRYALMLLINGEEDMEVVGHAADGRAAVEQARRLSPDVVIMDLSLPRSSGLQAIASIRRDCADAKILTLTRHAPDGYLHEV